MLDRLNNLELAALLLIAQEQADIGQQLWPLFRSSMVVARENTGHGFFTTLRPDRNQSPPLTLSSPLGTAWIDIEGFRTPMGFLLWLTDGYPSELEGFTTVDDTTGIDFAAVRFG